ncbi:MAG: hypothetical protein IIX15_04090, partial [Clostridia bacterium]|nr:hypothetical protein [Clostridia bacterium]
ITVFRKGDSNTTTLLSGSLEEVADNCFLQTAEMAEEFKDFVEEAHANDKTVVLFRYAETDFYSETAKVEPAIEGHAMVSWQTAFLDFDVIWLGFHDKEQNLIVVPVSNTPEDVMTGVQMPNTTDTDKDLVGEQLKDQFKSALDKLKERKNDILRLISIIFACLIVIALVPLVVVLVPKLQDAISRLGTGERRSNGTRRSRKSSSSRRRRK